MTLSLQEWLTGRQSIRDVEQALGEKVRIQMLILLIEVFWGI